MTMADSHKMRMTLTFTVTEKVTLTEKVIKKSSESDTDNY